MLPMFESIRKRREIFTHKVNPLYPSSEWPAKACMIVPNNSATVACRGGPRACAFVIERIERKGFIFFDGGFIMFN